MFYYFFAGNNFEKPKTDFDILIEYREKNIVPYYGFSLFSIKLLFLKKLYTTYNGTYSLKDDNNKLNALLFKDALTYSNVNNDLLFESIREVIDFVNNSNYTDELIEFIKFENPKSDYLETIEKIIDNRGRDKSSLDAILTNKYLFEFVISIIKKHNGEKNYIYPIYMPFIGVNPYVFKTYQNQTMPLDFYATNSDSEAIAIMQMIYIMNNNFNGKQEIKLNNFFLDDRRGFNYIYCDTPISNVKNLVKTISVDNFKNSKFEINSKNSEILIVNNVLERLYLDNSNEDNLAIVSVSDNFLTSTVYEKYRRYLLENRYIYGIIQTGKSSFGYSGNINLLLLKHNESPKIKFYNLGNNRFKDEKDLVIALKAISIERSIPHEEILYRYKTLLNINFIDSMKDTDSNNISNRSIDGKKNIVDKDLIKKDIDQEINNLFKLIKEFNNIE